MDHNELIELARSFIDAFNRNDLEAVMGLFDEDALYDECNGRRNQGKAAIRRAFEPQFSGAFGEMRFLDEDLFATRHLDRVCGANAVK